MNRFSPSYPYAISRLLLVLLTAALAAGGLLVATPAQAAVGASPVGSFDAITAVPGGLQIAGWALDPDTSAAIPISVTIDGKVAGARVANAVRADVGRAYPRSGASHGFTATFLVASGGHAVCITAINVGGGVNRALGCLGRIARVSPMGRLDAGRQTVGGAAVLAGWAFDPDAATAVTLTVTDGGKAVATAKTGTARPDVARAYPLAGPNRGFLITVALAVAGPHTMCVTATNIGLGLTPTTSLGCVTVTIAVNPLGNLHAIPRPLASTSITVDGWAVDPETASPVTVQLVLDGKAPVNVVANLALPALVVPYLGLGNNHLFRITIPVDYNAHRVCATAINLLRGVNYSMGCQTSKSLLPPIGAVTSPALISTSRYIRNINGSAADVTKTRAMGVADAAANPSNHKYLMLLQIGGQTTTGIILSATSTFVSYAQTVTALKAYIDGYAATQRVNAPATIAIGTNNDVDVRAATGIIWAQQLVNPLRVYAQKYPNITVAGANDIEPGFIASVAKSQDWLAGYLRATLATFVFNGSADGCGWTATSTRCNNGWNAANLAWLSGAAAPTRIISLPQIYNYTMPQQWKYISLTNVIAGKPKINFAGPLTEWTACYTQKSGCGSLTNNDAWTALWTQLRSDARTSQASLPYGTDLRIN